VGDDKKRGDGASRTQSPSRDPRYLLWQQYANLACCLASDAGSYVTGTAINLDGGACPVV
jgi:hypothetical protein